MSNIQKRKGKVAKKKSEPEEYTGPAVLDVILYDRERFYRVLDINFKKKTIKLESIGGSGWDQTISFEDYAKKGIKLDKPLEQYKEDMLRNITTDFAEYDEEATESKSTEVTITSGKDNAIAAKRIMEQATNKLAIMNAIMERERNKLQHYKNQMLEKLEAITRVVDIIELYMGIHEEIVQIQEGDPAPADTQICFRQLVLHMDEEVADTKDKGLDFEKIGLFDRWLDKNLDRVIPEKKGVVVLRPRRSDKDYRLEEGSDDLFERAEAHEKNQLNKLTYILIRNGANVYRIFTGNLQIYPKLFPSAEEMKKLMDMKEDDHRWDKEKKDNKILAYKRNVLMLQGLLDRTNVLRPAPPNLNLLNPNTYGDMVRFIHDADNTLGDGRPAFRDWLHEINAKLKRGDRLFFTGYPWEIFGSSRDRDTAEERRRFPIPGWTHRPESGVYNIKKVETGQFYSFLDKESVAFTCHHKPDDKVYRKGTWRRSSSYEDRKMSVPFRLFSDDDFIINYELIDREAIEYYLNDRVNRQEYLKMMPVLRGLLKMLAEEKKWEDGFIQFMKGQHKVEEPLIREAIAWWKTKVIEKRPLTREDAKAVKMIGDYIKRKLK